MKSEIYDVLVNNPVIAAIKDEDAIQVCCKNQNIRVAFVLSGDILSIAGIVKQLHEANKVVFVHVDLIQGLSHKEVSVDFIASQTFADGIISTRPSCLKRAKQCNLASILRIFALDSMAYENIVKQVHSCLPDMIEVLPGIMPKVISKVEQITSLPVIAGGLISEKEEIVSALQAGAMCVSSSHQHLWNV